MRSLRGNSSTRTPEQRIFKKNTNKNIWQVYSPLALSWFFMAWEGQLALWLIGQMPNTKVNQAGFLIIMGIAIFIESPVIDLLSTGTTLGTTKPRFQILTKFTLILMAWVTYAHCAVIFSPAYKFVAEVLLDAPPAVADAAWYGLAWMPIWSAAVGWRRYRQGIMIRAGKTGPISWGTLIRMSVMFVVGFTLYASKVMTGLGIIGVAFTAAVIAEAIYIHIASQPVLKNLPNQESNISHPSWERLREGQKSTDNVLSSETTTLLIGEGLREGQESTDNDLSSETTTLLIGEGLREGQESTDNDLSSDTTTLPNGEGLREGQESKDNDLSSDTATLPIGEGLREGQFHPRDQDLTLTQIFKFHIPLTASTILMLTTPIFLTRALNEGAQPVIAMAAWQIASTVVWLFRAMTFALPEAVISLYKFGREKLLFRFCSQVGIGLTSMMLLSHFTGFDKFIFTQIYRAEPLVAERAAIAFLWTSFVPALNSWMAYYRGILTSHHITSARMIAIGVAVAGLLLSLYLGLQFNPLSVILAAAALTIAHIVELLTLAIFWRNSAHNTPHKPVPSESI